MIISLIGFGAILILAFMRMPLGFALGLVGFIGFAELSSYRAAISNAARLVIDSGQNYGLSVLPMFILMGLLVERGGMARELYRAAYVFLGHRRGGLAMSTIVACGLFSAICGSSLATAATMSKVSMPEMRRYFRPARGARRPRGGGRRRGPGLQHGRTTGTGAGGGGLGWARRRGRRAGGR